MRARGAVAFGAALTAFLCLGLWLGGHPANLPGFLRDPFVSSPAGLTAEAAEAIQDNYWRPVGSTELGNASLQGMVRELRRRHRDRFSDYFSPRALEAFNQGIEGRFSGIGISVVPVKRGLEAVKVYRGSPAERAGIEPGEVIVSVEGRSIAGEDSTAATERIKGPEGTRVTIGLLEPKSGKVRRKTLTRAEVSLPNVSGRVEKANGREIGYVRMLSFSEGVHAQLERAVRKVEREGAKAIVLDLRKNPGGLLDEAVSSAGVFLPEGEVVVSTRSRTQGDSVHKTGGGNLPPRPLVVLIDRNTASAAEILTAALADDGGATVVGTRSFGKGVFQEEQDLANGGALKLTVGEFFTPKGVNLARSHGIHPSVKVADDPHTAVDEALRRALRVAAVRAE
ncbi:MAG TPA: S41 family peptidase [Solirubrobacterales bacterium]|nr:S41 family peptidase [Solirubrobacterales bacterium]